MLTESINGFVILLTQGRPAGDKLCLEYISYDNPGGFVKF